MVSYNPPLETLPIFDNSVFISTSSLSSTSYITVAQANLLYLRKTVADVATALETFYNGLIVGPTTPTIATLSGTGGTSLGWNYTNFSGETDLINYRGGGGSAYGGFNFYDQETTPVAITPDILTTISRSSTGITLPTIGGIYANSLSLYRGLYLPTITYVPVAGQLGYVQMYTVPANSPMISGTPVIICALTMTKGVYQFSYCIKVVSTGAVGAPTVLTNISTYITATSPVSSYPNAWATVQNNETQTLSVASEDTYACNGSVTIGLSTNQTVNVYYKAVFTGTIPDIQGSATIPQSYLTSVRIA
jgi:hypothetical protein